MSWEYFGYISSFGDGIVICLHIALFGCLSMLFRVISFDKMDSWALEFSFAALLYNIGFSIYTAESIEDFRWHELPRLIILFMFTLAISAVHHHYSSICLGICCSHFDRARDLLLSEADRHHISFKVTNDRIEYDDDREDFDSSGNICADFSDEQLCELIGWRLDDSHNPPDRKKLERQYLYVLEDRKMEYMTKLVMLQEGKQLAERALSVLYSANFDASSFNRKGYLRRRIKKDGGASKGFRPKKTATRTALANIINNLRVEGMPILHEEDFNINTKQQRTGLKLFQVFMFLSYLVGSRFFF